MERWPMVAWPPPRCGQTIALFDADVRANTRPTGERKIGAVEPPAGEKVGTNENAAPEGSEAASEIAEVTEGIWWTAGGSNSRPPRCERGALPTELAAHSDEPNPTANSV